MITPLLVGSSLSVNKIKEAGSKSFALKIAL
jgi:hypothetical protein